MSDNDLIASLGLGETAAETAATNSVEAEGADTAGADAARAPRTEIKVNAISKGKGALPAQAPRGGFGEKRGSKYPFEDLGAPEKDGEGNWVYDYFEVKLSDTENADAKKLQSAVQAATAQQNKAHKDDKSKPYYVSRTIVEDGAYVGSAVYRVDTTLDAAE